MVSLRRKRRNSGSALHFLALLFAAVAVSLRPLMVSSFQPSERTVSPLQSHSRTTGGRSSCPFPVSTDNQRQQRHQRSRQSSTSLNMFMGSDGGLFGIGTPELATILLVGYFVLGPSDLYKLVKEIGKFIQNVRTLGTEATKTFENTMESQLELQEIRKAQRELNDAFSFRRSINVDDQGEAFSTTPGPVEPPTPAAEAAAGAAAASATSEAEAAPPKRKKKKRRRVKKKQPPAEAEQTATTTTMESSTATTTTTAGNVPDLDMTDAFPKLGGEQNGKDWFSDEEKSDMPTKLPSASEMAKEDLAWLAEDNDVPAMTPTDPKMAAAEQSRFQQQLNSAAWNQNVMDNQDKLEPLALIMQKLALLEEEKAAADKRLEEEYQERMQLEEDFYRQKRQLLEDTAAKVQQDAYVTMDGKK